MIHNHKLYSEAKFARFERDHLVNYSKYHKITVKRFHRGERKAAKQQLKAMFPSENR